MDTYTKDEQLSHLLIASDLAVCTRRFYSTDIDYGYDIINKQVGDVVYFTRKCIKQIEKEEIREKLSEQSQIKVNFISDFFVEQIEDIQQYKQDKDIIGQFAGELLEAAHLAVIDAVIICKSVHHIQLWRNLEASIKKLLQSMYAVLGEDEIVQGGMDMYMNSLNQEM